jgi:superfamily II DNA or RNA helicase
MKRAINKKIPAVVKKAAFTITDVYKELVRSQSYLGKKGYTIPKVALDTADYEFLKKDLYMTPFVMGSFASTDVSSFPMYRENTAKMYLPRFYGVERYGVPDRSDLSEGENIDIDFVKELRPYQTKIIDVYMNHVQVKGGSSVGGGGILEVPCGKGKTVMALNIISKLCKKTLILVHKEFLMNQWIERITEFMPSARVGKIQGPVFDVAGNDIVIGMIQTMHSRDFEASAFEPFGLTIIDEVHRIGSEEFSKTLFKVVTPYMLGISATVERKDRLTKILYMNIGPKIYSEERTDEDVVNVRAITYKTNDSTFNTTEYDFRGSPKYSTMISKLCAFGPRSDFIVRVIADLQTEHPHKQIMVLAHNRDLLTYLYEAIRHKISAAEETVGYYVGGMKEKDLKITEGRRIVLATYAMAAEALDIKTLSTLIMATPKTDIEQSVGRILRAKGQNPIVVDILDTHDYLKRQWNTRKSFYRKCNYRIMSISSTEYTGFGSEQGWKLEFDPKTNVVAEGPKKCMITIPKEVLDAEKVGDF